MHGGIRETPERVVLVGQKVGGSQGIVTEPDGFTAEHAVGLAGFDPLHGRMVVDEDPARERRNLLCVVSAPRLRTSA